MPRCIVAFSPSKYDVPEWLLNRQLWIMLSMTCLVPLAFLRRLDSLKGISYVALCTVGNLVFVVVYKYFDKTGLPERGVYSLHLPVLQCHISMLWTKI
jgi:amino acid permease